MENNSIDPNQQTQNPVSPVNPSSKSKIVPIGLGIIVVLVVAVGAYTLGTKQSQPVVQNTISPTPLPAKASATEGDPTANWKTVTIADKYKVQIPTVMENDNNPRSPYAYSANLGKGRYTIAFSTSSAQIDLEKTKPGGMPHKYRDAISFEDYYNNNLKDFEGNYNYSYQKIQNGNYPMFIQKTKMAPEIGSTIYVWTGEKNELLLVSVQGEYKNSDLDEVLALLEEFINHLKYLEQ